ncbi:hypothetical protein BG011_001536 [Mortierella polycephala]|uniref:Uncharacterized protein n=1 Tax=Mortierella polycephala TaxID=41804 RepID=A0A9P6PIS5_9FUNG|nr:hypothetical protein BG011_001536 [Mortierella polycephala]
MIITGTRTNYSATIAVDVVEICIVRAKLLQSTRRIRPFFPIIGIKLLRGNNSDRTVETAYTTNRDTTLKSVDSGVIEAQNKNIRDEKLKVGGRWIQGEISEDLCYGYGRISRKAISSQEEQSRATHRAAGDDIETSIGAPGTEENEAWRQECLNEMEEMNPNVSAQFDDIMPREHTFVPEELATKLEIKEHSLPPDLPANVIQVMRNQQLQRATYFTGVMSGIQQIIEEQQRNRLQMEQLQRQQIELQQLQDQEQDRRYQEQVAFQQYLMRILDAWYNEIAAPPRFSVPVESISLGQSAITTATATATSSSSSASRLRQKATSTVTQQEASSNRKQLNNRKRVVAEIKFQASQAMEEDPGLSREQAIENAIVNLNNENKIT